MSPESPFLRRVVFALLTLLICVCLATLAAHALAPGGWSAWKLIALACFAGFCPWLGIGAAQAVIGAVLLTRGLPALQPGVESGPLPRTAIAVPVRDEDMDLVLPPLRRLLDGLDHAGAGDCFALFVLSDTADPAHAAMEPAAVGRFRAADRDPGRIHYRRRRQPLGWKAGNLMDFLDREASEFKLALVLDADSEMSARAVLRLARMMQADPGLGLVQQLASGQPAWPGFARIFQFGMRAGMRCWAAALAWWQGEEGPYWGHNAMLRIAPFRAHCRLPSLPGGGAILSHDLVEAALLASAGWRVRLVPDDAGSREANPPSLPDFLRRDLRWMEGTLQYRYLLRWPGLRPMGRWQMVQAMLMFLGSPFHLGFLAAAAWGAAFADAAGLPAGPVALATSAALAAQQAPKLVGYAEMLAAPARPGRLAASIAMEIAFSLALEPVLSLARTGRMAALALGRRPSWAGQRRMARPVSWGEAARLLWPQTTVGVALLAGFAAAGPMPLLWALPLAGGLAGAIPFCVATAHPRLSAVLRRAGVCDAPEEPAPERAMPDAAPAAERA